MKTRFLLALITSTCILSPDAYSQETPENQGRERLKPRAEINARPGTDRSIFMGEVWMPIAQNPEEGNVLYGDLRTSGDRDQNYEMNAGLGYREMVNDVPVLGDGVAGVHGWYDQRFTERDSEFSQITIGGEWLGKDFDILANGYIPLSDAETHFDANPNASNSGFSGTQLLVNTAQTVKEEPLAGVDLELGVPLTFLEGDIDSVRVYGGGYHFWGDDAESVTGGRIRFNADLTSDFSVGARWQYDDVRKSQAFFDITVRLPFGNKKSYQENGLYARLDESPERDIDIVSNEAVVDNGVNKVLLNTRTGLAQEIYHVDNAAAGGGNGSAENPFNTLAAAQAAASTDDIIYVHRGNGTSAGQNAGITLDDQGQMLMGSGVALAYDSTIFRTSNGNAISSGVIEAAGLAPVITNGAGNGVTVTADNVRVQGLTINGATGDGIDVTNVNNLHFANNSITNSGVNGIGGVFTGTTGTHTIANNLIDDSGQDAVDFVYNGASNNTLNVSSNTMDDNTANAVFVRTNGTTTLALNADGNTVTDTNAADANNFDIGRGIWLYGADNSVSTVQISNNSFDRNRGESVELEARDGIDSKIYGVIENNVSDNALHSVTTGANNTHFFTEAHAGGNIGDSTNRFIIRNNTATNGSEEGIVTKSVGGVSYAESYGNTTVGNDDGQEVRSQGGGYSDTIFHDNISYNNRESGIQVDTVTDTGETHAHVYNNQLYNNLGQGLFIGSISNGTAGTVSNPVIAENNNIYGNTLNGIIVKSNNGTGHAYTTIRDNNIHDGPGNGMQIEGGNGNTLNATVSNNQITDHAQRGIIILNRQTSHMHLDINDNIIDTAATQGIYVDGRETSVTQADFDGNTIQNITGDGMEFSTQNESGVTGSVTNNIISSNTDQGLSFSVRGTDTGADVDTIGGYYGANGAPVIVSGNRISGSTNNGIEIRSSEANGVGYFRFNNNQIVNNTGRGVNINEFDSTTAQNNIIADFGGGTQGATGGNSIYDNGGINAYYNPDINGTALKAENNWWGQDADPSTFDETYDSDGANETGGANGGTVDANPRLSTAP